MVAAVKPEWVVAIAAVAQAVTAVIIGILTFNLVKATRAYVNESRALAEQARRTNDMAERNTERTLRKQAASLQVRPGGRSRLDDGRWQFDYVVENVGADAAHGTVLSFEQGEAVAGEAIRPGETARLLLTVSGDDMPDNPPHPALNLVTFQDPDGSWWTQLTRRGRLLPPEPLKEE